MKSLRVKCPCGKLLAVPEAGRPVKFKCPACGAILQLRPQSTPGQATPRQSSARPTTSHDGAYTLATDSQPRPEASWNKEQNVGPETWSPSQTTLLSSQAHNHPELVASPRTQSHSDECVDADEFPGPFIDRSGLLYAWLYPTWVCWLGLTFMAEVSVWAFACTAMFFVVAMVSGAFGSLFTFGAMMTGCLGLASYLATTFICVLEGTANGDNRLHRLPGYVWYDILGPFLRTACAAAAAYAVSFCVTYGCRHWLGPWNDPRSWYDPQVLFLNDLIAVLFFPIFMITNSIDQSFIPVYSLFSTLRRLGKCFGHFFLFLLISGGVWAAMSGVFWTVVRRVPDGELPIGQIAAALTIAGPILSTWLLYYGHWLGRLARQLSAVD